MYACLLASSHSYDLGWAGIYSTLSVCLEWSIAVFVVFSSFSAHACACFGHLVSVYCTVCFFFFWLEKHVVAVFVGEVIATCRVESVDLSGLVSGCGCGILEIRWNGNEESKEVGNTFCLRLWAGFCCDDGGV